MIDKIEKMDAPEFGRSLSGLGINLLVNSVASELEFLTGVLLLEVLRSDKDFAVVRYLEQIFMIHGDHTYDRHPLSGLLCNGTLRGVGIELRLYNLDPDEACQRAEKLNYDIFAPAQDKPHGLRESYLASPSGYMWVPSVSSLAHG
ncbi:hypothetical protein [Kiloniella antarctica]|uniref:Glyoxalase n=1 Tax=Kiloniella antarctica TaxID=1550907 RepID=A0ABW5BJM1_9PROT